MFAAKKEAERPNVILVMLKSCSILLGSFLQTNQWRSWSDSESSIARYMWLTSVVRATWWSQNRSNTSINGGWTVGPTSSKHSVTHHRLMSQKRQTRPWLLWLCWIPSGQHAWEGRKPSDMASANQQREPTLHVPSQKCSSITTPNSSNWPLECRVHSRERNLCTAWGLDSPNMPLRQTSSAGGLETSHILCKSDCPWSGTQRITPLGIGPSHSQGFPWSPKIWAGCHLQRWKRHDVLQWDYQVSWHQSCHCQQGPTKFSFKCDGRARWSNLPAMQQDFNKHIHTK